MKAIDIVKKYLKENGYDGLCHPDYECGCDIKDLAPCDSCFADCLVGHKKEDTTGEYDYLIVPKKE